jgi:ABC-type uncharacterized transport system ATPase subunit
MEKNQTIFDEGEHSLSLLQVKRLTKYFGGLVAVDDLDMEVEKGEIHALIGPNGSGKTTIFNMISSVLKPSTGRIIFDGQEITNKSPSRVPKYVSGSKSPIFGRRQDRPSMWLASGAWTTMWLRNCLMDNNVW